MIITVRGKPGETEGTLTAGSVSIPCALGRSGIVAEANKVEGDGATPAGRWPLRLLFYRADRLKKPGTELPVCEISQRDGWCDDPSDPLYNKPTTLPYDASTERLWREDRLYDLCAVLGHNDNPVVPNKGSAIFFHVAVKKKGGLQPTEGCVALPESELVCILRDCTPDTVMEIELEGAD